MKKVFSLMLLLATLLTFTACGGDDEPDNTKLSQTSYTTYHDDTQEIKGTNLSDIVWSSENEFVATVKNNVIHRTVCRQNYGKINHQKYVFLR